MSRNPQPFWQCLTLLFPYTPVLLVYPHNAQQEPVAPNLRTYVLRYVSLFVRDFLSPFVCLRMCVCAGGYLGLCVCVIYFSSSCDFPTSLILLVSFRCCCPKIRTKKGNVIRFTSRIPPCTSVRPRRCHRDNCCWWCYHCQHRSDVMLVLL